MPPDSTFILLLPLFIGVFVGAPLLPRELRTAPFIRTQGATLRRWLAVKLGLVILATLIFSAVLSLIYTWWSYPASAFFQDIWGNYEHGIVLIGWSLFDLLLGVTIGALIRRPVPAMNDDGYAAMASKCIKEKHLQWKIVYQPPERYWSLQILETSLLLALSVALLPLIYWLSVIDD